MTSRLLVCAHKIGSRNCSEPVQFIKTFKGRPPTEREYYCELHGLQENNAAYTKDSGMTGYYLTPVEGSWAAYYEKKGVLEP